MSSTESIPGPVVHVGKMRVIWKWPFYTSDVNLNDVFDHLCGYRSSIPVNMEANDQMQHKKCLHVNTDVVVNSLGLSQMSERICESEVATDMTRGCWYCDIISLWRCD